MGYTDVIPKGWIVNRQWGRFRWWVRKLPVESRVKKALVVEFCDMCGIPLTADRIKECGVVPGEV